MSDNKAIISNLFTAMEEEIFAGDRLGSREFATIMNPGQFVSTNLTEDPDSYDMLVQADLANRAIDSQFAYVELSGSVDQIYQDVTEFAKLPRRTITPAQERELQDIRGWMATKESDYVKYRDRYFDALFAYQAETSRPSPDPAVLRRLARTRDDALDTWNRRGWKRDWENRQARLDYLLRGSVETFWNDLIRRRDAGQQQTPDGKPYKATHLVPPPARWLDPATSWGSFQRTINESSSVARSRTTAWSASVGWGLWSARASGSTSYQHRESDASEIQVKFDYLRVRILRPWLVPDVFNYRFWTWKNPPGFRTLSDGGMLNRTPPVRPLGEMPLLPTHLIVAKNVEVSARWSHEDETFYQSQFEVGGGFGIGPFSFGGSYQERNTEHRAHGRAEGGTLKIEQPQVVAYTGILLPQTPNPDLSLPWGSEDDVRRSQRDADRLAELAARDHARLEAEAWLEAAQREGEEELRRRRLHLQSLADARAADGLRELLAGGSGNGRPAPHPSPVRTPDLVRR